jgi:hypothetical protein
MQSSRAHREVGEPSRFAPLRAGKARTLRLLCAYLNAYGQQGLKCTKRGRFAYFALIVVGYEGYCKPIQEKQGSGMWGIYKSHRNRPGCSRGTIPVQPRLALGADPDSIRHSDLYAGLEGGIYLR